MIEVTYIRHIDDVLLAVADRQTGPNLLPVNMDELNHEMFADRPPTWVQTIIAELERRGYGKDFGTMNSRVFMVNGAGLARAAEIRGERSPRNFTAMLKSVTRSDWIAFGAFVVSVIAMFKD